MAGVNNPEDDTPGPAQVPPAGLKPVNWIGAELAQIVCGEPVFTTGGAVTVITWVAEAVQPFCVT